MKSLLRSISNRSNSTTSNTDSNEQPRPSISTGTSARPPVLPSISTGISILPISHLTPSIPIPNIRRSSEPVPVERWARPSLPSYAVSRIPDNRALPEYEDVITPNPGTGINDDHDDQRFLHTAVGDYFGVSPNTNTLSTSITTTEESALNSSTENGITTENENAHENPFEDQDNNDVNVNEEDDDDDDDPLIPRRRILDIHSSARRNTFTVSDRPHSRPDLTTILSSSLGHRSTPLGGEETSAVGYIDLPVPISEPPIYSPSLGRDELRLYSTVHLSSNHPASAYFNAIAQSPPPPAGPIPYLPYPGTTPSSSSNGGLSSANSNTSTGNKKLKLTITRGGKRMNSNGTGPLYIKTQREEWVEGIVEVGKVDRAIGLEVSIMGMVNVSYYVRGQYTVLDTLPLARNKIQLFPSTSETSTSGHSEQTSNTLGVSSIQPSTPNDSRPSSTSNLIPPSAPPTSTEPLTTKDGQPLIAPFTTFNFSLQMPTTHYKDTSAELPPSCDLQQVGMQSNVEYVLRVKLIRKGLRFNETLTIPVIYEPRAFIPPRRLRALTLDDPLNPGWRTIELNGGKPKTKSNLPIPVGSGGPGIEANLLLPSPPIFYIPSEGELPKFPFHLHFHSTLPHVLSTFSNPSESKFVIRLTRVTIFRIGIEKEIRRIEIPTKVEVWQEGGEHILLGPEGLNNQSTSSSGGGGGGGRRGSTPSSNRRNSVDVDSTNGQESGLSSSVPTTGGFSENAPGGGGGGPLRRFSSAGSSSDSPRRKSFLGERKGSFSFKRRGSTSNQNASSSSPSTSAGTGNVLGSGTGVSSPIAIMGNLPPTIDENDHDHDQSTSSPTRTTELPTSPITARGPDVGLAGSSPIVPVDMTSTDVHLKGLISIKPLFTNSTNIDLIRRLMIQSFIVPEMTLTYVLEIGIEPKKGYVKENFSHIWGGGVIEVVLGRR